MIIPSVEWAFSRHPLDLPRLCSCFCAPSLLIFPSAKWALSCTPIEALVAHLAFAAALGAAIQLNQLFFSNISTTYETHNRRILCFCNSYIISCQLRSKGSIRSQLCSNGFFFCCICCIRSPQCFLDQLFFYTICSMICSLGSDVRFTASSLQLCKECCSLIIDRTLLQSFFMMR